MFSKYLSNPWVMDKITKRMADAPALITQQEARSIGAAPQQF